MNEPSGNNADHSPGSESPVGPNSSQENSSQTAGSGNQKPQENLQGQVPVAGVDFPAQGLPLGQLPYGMQPAALLAMQQQSWTGPYPPPEAAERFEKICPGAFDRILTMVENGQKNQIDISQKQIVIAENGQKFLAQDTKRGHWLGVIVSISAIGGATYCASIDEKTIAGFLLGIPVMSVAIALTNANKTKGNSQSSSVPVSNLPAHAPENVNPNSSKSTGKNKNS